MNTLHKLALKYGTDKAGYYTGLYHALFCARREEVRSVLEIGIRSGASLRMWADYFPDANIMGLDINPSTMFDVTKHICTAVCDQRDLKKLGSLTCCEWDLIVDDGDHSPESQIATALTLVPRLAPDGIYVIEDVNELERVSKALPFEHVIVGVEPQVAKLVTGRAIVIFNG